MIINMQEEVGRHVLNLFHANVRHGIDILILQYQDVHGHDHGFSSVHQTESGIYTVNHRFGGRRFVCFGIDPVSAMVQKQNTRNV